MSFLRLKRSITEFIYGSKKTKHATKACMSVDEALSSMADPELVTVVKQEADEISCLEALGDAYYEPDILDVHRSIKCGLGTPLELFGVSFAPASQDITRDTQSPVLEATPAIEPLNTAEDLAVVSYTPLLPSTPVLNVDVSSALGTPSLTCSTPDLSSPISDDPAASFTGSRVVKIQDFELLEFLSKGSSGQVYLARDNISNKSVALKVIRKVAGVWDHPFVKQILIEEKKIMASLQGSDWFVQLEASWHDTNNIYLAMMYCPTDIESEIIRCGKFPADRARFYMVEMIIALDELHKRGIIHRDIKPANILVGADGHIVLADFGLAKDFGSKPTLAERSYQPYWPFKTDDNVDEMPYRSPAELTFVSNDWCGSEMEMAPEIVRRNYYSFGVDYWSAGITLYAMVTGRHPWDEDEDIATQILKDDIKFDAEDDVSDQCQDFIHQLLKKDPGERIIIGLNMISHLYFVGVDWEAMRNRMISPPWVPDFVKGHHFFEEWGTIEYFEPGSAISEEEEAILPDFVYASPELQCDGVKDESQISPDPQHSFPDEFFGYLFASAENDDLDEEEELWAFDIEDDDFDDTRPVNEVEVHSPVLSLPEHLPEHHAYILPSFHSGSSLLGLVESEEPELPPTPPVICNESEPVALQTEYHVAETTLETTVDCVKSNIVEPELVESRSLLAPPGFAASSNKCVARPLFRFSPPFLLKPKAEPTVMVNHTNASAVLETAAEITQFNVVLESPEPKPPRPANVPSVEVTVKFPRPAPFQPVLEPLVECAEPTTSLEPVPTLSGDCGPKEQVKTESRVILSCKKVMSWLKKLLPSSRRRGNASGLPATLSNRDDSDTSLWGTIKRKFQKIWVSKVKHNQCLQQKRTIL